jgi:hypothetical protein
MTSRPLRPRQSPAAGAPAPSAARSGCSGPVSSNMALRPRQHFAPAPSAGKFPESDNPLTLALIQSTRVQTHTDMVQAVRLIRALESKLTGCEVDRCRLAAEVLIERKLA